MRRSAALSVRVSALRRLPAGAKRDCAPCGRDAGGQTATERLIGPANEPPVAMVSADRRWSCPATSTTEVACCGQR